MEKTDKELELKKEKTEYAAEIMHYSRDEIMNLGNISYNEFCAKYKNGFKEKKID